MEKNDILTNSADANDKQLPLVYEFTLADDQPVRSTGPYDHEPWPRRDRESGIVTVALLLLLPLVVPLLLPVVVLVPALAV